MQREEKGPGGLFLGIRRKSGREGHNMRVKQNLAEGDERMTCSRIDFANFCLLLG
jgi:hypothetical protein